jgi:hypothetical protein
MVFKEIFDNDSLYSSIYMAFLYDDELVNQYHIVNDDIEKCVKDTYNKILIESKSSELRWYSVNDDNDALMGFLIVSLSYGVLYSFGLNINYRKEHAKEFFDNIKELLNNNFGCGLWTKNTRTIKYLIRNGMQIVRKERDITILKY